LPASYTGGRYPSRWWRREVAREGRSEVAPGKGRSKVLRGWRTAVATLVASVSAAVVVPATTTSTTVLVAASSTAVVVVIVAATVVVVAAASVVVVVSTVSSTSSATTAAEATAFVGATY